MLALGRPATSQMQYLRRVRRAVYATATTSAAPPPHLRRSPLRASHRFESAHAFISSGALPRRLHAAGTLVRIRAQGHRARDEATVVRQGERESAARPIDQDGRNSRGAAGGRGQ